MNPPIREDNLKHLRRYLQEQLTTATHDTPLQVQCAVKDGLMVLVQHPPGVAPNPQAVFMLLEHALTHLPLDLAEPLLGAIAKQQANLFLRVLGQQKPYTFHGTTLAAAAPDDLENEIDLEDEIESEGPLTVIQGLLPKAPAIATEANETSNVFSLPESFWLEHERSEPLPPDTEADADGELVHQPGTLDFPRSPYPEPLAQAPERSWLRPLLLVGSGLAAMMVLGVGGYALTRPCVMGGCPALETVAQLGNQATATLQAGNSVASQSAHQQIATAQTVVSAVPRWSRYYDQAQTLQQPLAQLHQAETKATEATQKSQATTQTVTDWQGIESLWQEAIAQAQAIPTTHPFYPYAQARLATFRPQLQLAQQRIQGEAGARKQLLAAQKTAELAIARQNTAKTLTEWQTAAATWQVAVNSLNQIPPNATSYAEAQQLLASYQPKLQATRDRARNEQTATTAQAQARKLAQQAQTWQQKNQWSQAIQIWRTALNQAKQIPTNTSLTATGQELIATYSSALQQAETVLTLRQDLEQICNAAGRICTYTLTNSNIRVEFIPAYERQVRTLGSLSQSAQDQTSLAQIDQHFASLSEALQAISNNAGLPVQVYNSDQDLIGSFLPGGG